MVTSVHNERMKRGLPCIYNHGTEHTGCICEMVMKINYGLGVVGSADILLAAGEPVMHAQDFRIEKIRKEEPVESKETTARVEYNAAHVKKLAQTARDAGSRSVGTILEANSTLLLMTNDTNLLSLKRPTAVSRLSTIKTIKMAREVMMNSAKNLIRSVEDDGYMERVLKSALADIVQEEMGTGPDFTKFAKK